MRIKHFIQACKGSHRNGRYQGSNNSGVIATPRPQGRRMPRKGPAWRFCLLLLYPHLPPLMPVSWLLLLMEEGSLLGAELPGKGQRMVDGGAVGARRHAGTLPFPFYSCS